MEGVLVRPGAAGTSCWVLEPCLASSPGLVLPSGSLVVEPVYRRGVCRSTHIQQRLPMGMAAWAGWQGQGVAAGLRHSTDRRTAEQPWVACAFAIASLQMLKSPVSSPISDPNSASVCLAGI